MQLLWRATAPLLLVSACAAPRPPVAETTALASTLVLPLVDLREKSDLKVEQCDARRPVVNTQFFVPVGSSHSYLPEGHTGPRLSADNFGAPKVEALRGFGAPGHDYIAATFLQRFDYDGGTFSYKLAAFVVRTDTGEVLWRNTLDDRKWLGILGAQFDFITGQIGGQSLCSFLHAKVAEAFTKMPRLTPLNVSAGSK